MAGSGTAADNPDVIQRMGGRNTKSCITKQGCRDIPHRVHPCSREGLTTQAIIRDINNAETTAGAITTRFISTNTAEIINPVGAPTMAANRMPLRAQYRDNKWISSHSSNVAP